MTNQAGRGPTQRLATRTLTPSRREVHHYQRKLEPLERVWSVPRVAACGRAPRRSMSGSGGSMHGARVGAGAQYGRT